jgi:serine/threonine protein phosphatase PrpC
VASLAPKIDTLDLTRDHKPDDVVERQRIQAHGGVVAEKRVWLREYPQCGLNLSRGFGDSLAHDVGVSHVPDVRSTFLSEDPGQFALLASDGVWEFISSEEAGQSVGDRLQEGRNASKKNSSQEAASCLVRHATDCWQRECNNELDDVTAIVVQI